MLRLKISVFCLFFAGVFLLALVVLQQSLFVGFLGDRKLSFAAQPGYTLLREHDLFGVPDAQVQVSIKPKGSLSSFREKAGAYTAYPDQVQEWLRYYSYSTFDFGSNTLNSVHSAGNPQDLLARNRDFFISQSLPDRDGVITFTPPQGVSVVLQIPNEAQVEISRQTTASELFVWLFLITGISLIFLGLVIYVLGQLTSRRNRYGRRSTYINRYSKARQNVRVRRQAKFRQHADIRQYAQGCRLGNGPDAVNKRGIGNQYNAVNRSAEVNQNNVGDKNTADRSPELKTCVSQTPFRSYCIFILCASLGLVGCSTNGQGVSNAELLREMHAQKIAKRMVDSLRTADLKLSDSQLVMKGTALRIRQAAHRMLRKNKDAKVDLPAFDTAASVKLALPERTDTWPRNLLLVIKSAPGSKGESLSPLVVLLRQNTPLDNYFIQYLARLTPSIVLPKLPTVEDGSVVVRPESKLFEVQPKDLVDRYHNLINNPDSSGLFDTDSDALVSQIRSSRKKKEKDLSGSSIVTFQDRQSGQIGMTTANGGVLVFVNMLELERVIPNAGYSIVPQSGGEVNLLSGIVSSARGLETTYCGQLLFYVPAVGSKEKIALLGFSRGICAAKEVR